MSKIAKFSLSCTRDPSSNPGNCQFISKPSKPYFLMWIHSNIFHFEIRRYIFTYLIKAKTLSMKALRVSGLSAMSEYFLDPSVGPPMAIETFSFGFFSFKLTTFLYWPARCQKYFNRKLIYFKNWKLRIFRIFSFIYLSHLFLLYQGHYTDSELNGL